MSKKKLAVLDLTAYNRTEDEKRPQPITVDNNLYLDPQNPRLAEFTHTGTQAAIQRIMEREFDIQPIVDSLYRNGFFWEEPLVAVRESLPELRGKTVLLVIEGNRRLAAINYIRTNPSKFPDQAARDRLAEVPVIIRDNREETLSFVGFRHVTGVMEWEPAAMAQYALRLVRGGHDVEEIAQLIGDKTKKIQRLIRTQSLVERVAEQDDATKKFFFSYLLTATDAPGTQNWLKLKIDPKKGVVTAVDDEKLKKLWIWLYGSKKNAISPVIPDSRQIHKLNRVLAVPAATEELEKTGNLSRADAYTKSREEYVAEVLGQVRSELQDMVGTVLPDGPLTVTAKNAEHITSSKKEFQKIETLFASLRALLGL